MQSLSNHYFRLAKAKKQAGVSLLTVAIVIGIGGLFLAVALTYGPRYFTKGKVQNQVAVYGDMRSNLVSYGSRVGLFTSTNASLTALVNQNFFPASMVGGTAAAPTVTNQWGGPVTVAIGTVVTAGDSLVFTDGGVPANACTELGTSIDGSAAVITINGTTTKAAGARSNPVTVGTSCGGASGDNNTIAVTIAK